MDRTTAVVSTDPWTRGGLVLPRPADGDGAHVVGDPCIVWDPDAGAWRMFLFYAPPGHGSTLSAERRPTSAGWGEVQPLAFANPDALPGGTHKPFVVMDAHHPNRAARAGGRYWLLVVSFTGAAREKRVQRAWAPTLAGPWTLEPGDLLSRGDASDFDEKHVDAVSGYWFEEHQCFLYYYMGYPQVAQGRERSTLGSALGVARQALAEPVATKLGVALEPSSVEGHWASGWVGGFQLLPGTDHTWVAVLNASPTPPDALGTLTSEEPAPSLAGFAYSDEPFPTEGWTFEAEPIEWVSDIPDAARAAGEGVNLWRQHILVLENEAQLYYNSGFYGEEQLYRKTADARAVGIAPQALPEVTEKPGAC